jgi:hypothetical protein
LLHFSRCRWQSAGRPRSKSDTIGPWEIEATFKADKFDRCSISRKLDDDIVAVRPHRR